LSLPSQPIASALARAGIRGMTQGLRPSLAADLALLVAEVVANAVQHAGMRSTDDILLRLFTDHVVRVEVVDRGPGFTPPRVLARPDSRESDGWGLFLVDHLSDAWGVVRDDSCTTVWFEIGRGAAA
jgi:anti-sigma regulatory factor (Ser/Thr protein kinase)